MRNKLVKILVAFLCAAFLFSSVAFSRFEKTSAQSMIVMCATTGRVLFEKNADAQMAPASTTKILTAITVLENCDDIDKVVEVPAAAVGVEGSSIYLTAGEKITIRDLLYGLMLQSGNDCAEGLAILTSGSIEKFAVDMAKVAEKAGAKNSNFITPHGLDAKGHLTTARDLAKITCYARQNKDFLEISKAKQYTTTNPASTKQRTIFNKNRLLNSFELADGVKTGFTKKAGRTFVGSATQDGFSLVCVVLNCGPMFEEAERLLRLGFSEYSLVEIKSSSGHSIYYPMTKAEEDEFALSF